MTKSLIIAAVFVAGLLQTGVAQASSEEDRLRQQLTATVLQLRDLQDRQAAAAAQQLGAGQGEDALKAELAATKAKLRAAQGGGAKLRALQTSLDQSKTATDQSAQALQRAQTELARIRDANAKASDTARDLAAERDRLQTALTHEQAVLGACQVRNAELVKVASELLSAYAKVGLGDVMEKREPLLGLKRVQLENLAQGYDDQIHQARCDASPAVPGGH